MEYAIMVVDKLGLSGARRSWYTCIVVWHVGLITV